MLKFREETTRFVDYGDLENLVNETYFGGTTETTQEGVFSRTAFMGDHPYSFVATEECGNDSDHTFSVTGEVAEYDEDELRKWIASRTREGWVQTGTLLDDLCRKGLIQPGTYVVQVCW